jgi:hypothetical protein
MFRFRSMASPCFEPAPWGSRAESHCRRVRGRGEPRPRNARSLCTCARTRPARDCVTQNAGEPMRARMTSDSLSS